MSSPPGMDVNRRPGLLPGYSLLKSVLLSAFSPIFCRLVRNKCKRPRTAQANRLLYLPTPLL